MNAILLTLFVSLLLAGLFIVLFIEERTSRTRAGSSPEQDALMPFSTTEKSVPARRACPAKSMPSGNGPRG